MMLIEFIHKRIELIQNKYNFNPNIGAKQVKGQSEMTIRAFGAFQELITILTAFGVNDIPYTVTNHVEKVSVQKQSYVYFIQAGNSNFWKIGKSENPNVRKRQLQTGQAEELFCRFKVLGDLDLEHSIHFDLKNFSTRGEWFEIECKTLLRYLKSKNLKLVK